MRPSVKLPESLDMNWFAGFVDGEGSFTVNIPNSLTKLGFTVQLSFNITQHIRDVELFKFIQKGLGCGNIYIIPKDSRVNLVVGKLSHIVGIIIPTFNKHPLVGSKRFELNDFFYDYRINRKKRTLDCGWFRKD